MTDPKNPDQEPEGVIDIDALLAVDEEAPGEGASGAEKPSSGEGAHPSPPRTAPRLEGENRQQRPPPFKPLPAAISRAATGAMPSRGGRLNTPPTGRPLVKFPSVLPPTPPTRPMVAASSAPTPIDERAALAPPEPLEPPAFVPKERAASASTLLFASASEGVEPVAVRAVSELLEPEPQEMEPTRPSAAQPVPLSMEVPEVAERSSALAALVLPAESFEERVEALSEAPLTLGGLDDPSSEDELDAAFRTLELDEHNDPDFASRATAAPGLDDALPAELMTGVSVVETREVTFAIPPPPTSIDASTRRSYDDLFASRGSSPEVRAPSEGLELTLASSEASVVPQILESINVPPLPPIPSLEGRSSDEPFEARLSPPPVAHVSAVPAPVEAVPVTLSDAPITMELIEEVEGSLISEAPEAVMIDGSDDATSDDAETEFVLEGGDEVDDEAGPADRGALLAASVTSRHRKDDDTELLYAVDPRAEALARAALLVDEADHAATPAQAAEMLALAADLYEGVGGDRARAKELATLAHALAPARHAPTRVLRRIEIADGNTTAALALCEEELAGPLDESERTELLLLAGELAAETEGADASRLWTTAATAGGISGALARIFSAGVARDRAAMGEALGAFATQAGGVLAASVDVARARLMEGAETQAAIQAIRDAVRRDPSDASAWLAMARIGLAQSNGGFFREAMGGLVKAGDGSATSVVAESLRRALDSVLGEPVAPGQVADAGVAGWLVAHALRDSSGDPSSQVTYGLAHAEGDEAARWAAWQGEGAGGDAGRYLALRKVLAQRGADDVVASGAAAFVGGGSSGAVEAGLRARGGSVDGTEADALGIAGGATGSVVRAALVAATSGIDAAEAVADATGDSVWHMIARVEAQARTGQREEARAAFETLAADEADAGATAYSLRAIALLGGDTPEVVEALRAEARSARDPRRAAGQHFLAACFAASANLTGGGADALAAANALPGDLAAAEIAALHALRGDAIPAAGADLLEAAAAGDGPAQRMAAVRAALRRASIDAEGAAEAVWRSWKRNSNDVSLGALVLRTPSRTGERAVAVARALADAAWSVGRDRADAAVGAGTFLALALEHAGRFADASQALARTRTLALHDRALAVAEERMWLRAGLFAEAAERAFDHLNAADSDAERIAAYERLAEIDRTYRVQVASAVLSLQEILSLAPGHMPSLHALLRFFTEQGRPGELIEVCQRLVEHAEDPADALAFAHLGGRVASAQAEGDPGAGASFHAAAFERGFFDVRLLNALEADVRRAGDHTRFAKVQSRLADATTDPGARSVYLTRAAQSYEALGDHSKALEFHVRAVDVLPTSVVARWGAGWSMLRAGEAANAAEMFEAAGKYSASLEAGAWSFDKAAALWRDTVGERTRALAALRQVLERDPGNRPAFHSALQILRDAGDSPGELDLVERYAQIETPGAEGDAALEMHARAAGLAEHQGDSARAVAQWRAVLATTPENVEALRALARLARAGGEWNVAADAMIRLAKLTTDTAERVELLFGLGEILDDHIGDAKRAEIAWRRVLSLSPRDARALERLMEVYRRTGDVAREADMLQSLVALASPGPERTEGLLRLASLAELSLNDAERAHAALEAARRDGPGDLKVLRGLRGYHARNGDMEAFVAIADRATVDVRRSADLNPRDLPILERLSEMLEVRGHDDASRIAAAVAVALGSRSDRARALAFDGTVKGIGAAALTPDALALLAPPAVSVPLREMLGRSAEVLDQLMPFDPKAFGAEKLGKREHPLRYEIARWAEVLGLPEVEIYVAARVPSVCAPVGRAPMAVMVPTSVELHSAARFAVARALLLMALSLTLPVRLAAKDLALVLGALLRQFEPMYRPEGVDARELVELAAGITRAMPRDLHAEIEPFADEVLQTGVKDAETITMGALEFGDRVALLATGDIAGGIALLSTPGTSPIEAVESVASVGRLVRVALSERFMEARRVAGADQPPEG